MAIIPVAQKFHTLSSTVNTVDRGSSDFQSQRTIYTMEDIINTVSATGGSIDGSGAQYALPVFTDTNTITNLPLGVADQVLKSGGPAGDPYWADLAASVYEVGGGTGSAKLVAGTNTAVGDYSVVSGGQNNNATNSACYQVIGGGSSNTSEGLYGTIGGGANNCEYGAAAAAEGYNVIAGGSSNEINNNAGTFIGGGNKNTAIEANAAGKTGGLVIGGGIENQICNPAGASAGILAATIAGGMENTIVEDVAGKSMETPTIGGGSKNCIYGVGKNGTIAGGSSNFIDRADDGVIVGGTGNTLSLAKAGFIGGGTGNNMASGADHSTIAGGASNATGAFSNVHILGSNITATQDDTTFVQGLTFSPLAGIPVAADNAAALALPLVVGSLYRSGADPDVVSIVH